MSQFWITSKDSLSEIPSRAKSLAFIIHLGDMKHNCDLWVVGLFLHVMFRLTLFQPLSFAVLTAKGISWVIWGTKAVSLTTILFPPPLPFINPNLLCSHKQLIYHIQSGLSTTVSTQSCQYVFWRQRSVFLGYYQRLALPGTFSGPTLVLLSRYKKVKRHLCTSSSKSAAQREY